MYCCACGKPFNQNDQFCAGCGNKFESSQRVSYVSAYRAAGAPAVNVQPVVGQPPQVLTPELMKLNGVDGWLAWFCGILILLQPIRFLGAAAKATDTLTIVLELMLAALSITTGIIIAKRKQAAFLWLKWYFGIIVGLSVVGFLGSLGDSQQTGAAIIEFVGGALPVIIWALYFRKSKRVLATFGRNL
jgi:hypothetical protein